MPKKDIHYFALTTPMDYHYNPDDELWYDVDTEEPPLPISKAVFDNNFKIEFFNGAYFLEDLNTYEEFADYAEEALGGSVGGPGFSFVFTNHKQEKIWCYFQSWILWEMDEFIEKVKANKFAFLFMEPFTCVKLLVWPLPNSSLRIVIQNCYEYDYLPGICDKDTGYKFQERVLDLEVNKKQFITAFEQAMNQAKQALRNMIINYAEKHNLSEEKTHYLAGKMGLEQKIED